MTVTELKAKAYDILAQIQYLQKELQKTNDDIAQAAKASQPETNPE